MNRQNEDYYEGNSWEREHCLFFVFYLNNEITFRSSSFRIYLLTLKFSTL